MASFNSDLNSLFKNYQNQQKFNKKAYDVDGDKKVDKKKDQKALTNEKNKLLAKENLFDINNDGLFNQKDVDLFIKGDVNGDGKTSKEEESFISVFAEKFAAFLKQMDFDEDFTVSGTRYIHGGPAQGVIGDSYYIDGKKQNDNIKEEISADGTLSKTYYLKNVKVYEIKENPNGTRTESTFSKNGKLITSQTQYLYNSDGSSVALSKKSYIYKNNVLSSIKHYSYDENGKASLASKDNYKYDDQGNMVSITTRSYDKNQNVIATAKFSANTYNNVPPEISSSQEGITIIFNGGLKLTLNNGETIKKSVHDIIVTSKDGKTETQYNIKGEITSYKVNGKKVAVSKAKKIPTPAEDKSISKTETIKNSDGKIAKKIEKDKDGNIISETEYFYDNGFKSKIIKRNYSNGLLNEVTTLKYNENNVCIEKSVISKNSETTTRYNDEGKVTYKKYINSFNQLTTENYTYEDNGNINITKKHYEPDGSLKALNKQVKDKNSKGISNVLYLYNTKTGKKIQKWNYYYKDGKILGKNIYTIDKNGKAKYDYTAINHAPSWYKVKPANTQKVKDEKLLSKYL